jgi:RelE toxin of RelE / RelB toxin-antitoxin system
LLALATIGPFVLPSLLEPMDDARCEAVTITAFRYVMGNRQRFTVTSVTSGRTWEVGAANAPFAHEYCGPGVLAIRRGRWTGKNPGSGGVRKLRWAAPGRGKRGGYRVIYYVRRTHGVIWMLTMYPKNVADNIPTHVLRQIRKEVEDG